MLIIEFILTLKNFFLYLHFIIIATTVTDITRIICEMPQSIPWFRAKVVSHNIIYKKKNHKAHKKILRCLAIFSGLTIPVAHSVFTQLLYTF